MSKWDGLDAALARMRGLTPALRKSGFRSAGVRAMKPVRDAARKNARRVDDPQTVASIPENIVTKSASRKKERQYGNDVFVTQVGVQGGARMGAKQQFGNTKRNQKRGVAGQDYSVTHWRFVELGTRHMKAQPFMRPALEENVVLVITAYVQALSPAIDKAVDNLRTRLAKKPGSNVPVIQWGNNTAGPGQ